MLLVQVSDLHLDGGPERRERAARTMAYVNGLRDVAAVLVTGDLADHGREDEYEQVRELLVSPHPLVHCPGNHDRREPYERVLLGREPTGGPVNSTLELDGLLVAMCDSSRPGRDDGLLEDGTLDWLDSVLAATDQPAVVCFHHPPVVLHSPLLDAIRLANADRLSVFLDNHPQVLAVLVGHAHTPAVSTFAGRPVVVAPAVVSTLRLPPEGRDDLDYELPPAVALHVLDGGRLTTHFRVVTGSTVG
jgi:3',5'-cyclic AMP phosphodiesterase CpdA